MNISSSVSSLATSMFTKLDTKKQGYLDKTDLEQAFANIDSSSSSTSSTSNVDEIFSQIDADQDGKITESELTTSINNLVDQLNAQLNSKLGQAGGDMPPPPPPPSEGGDDTGFTKDELTQIASTTDDTKLASLMSNIAANFDAADTNQDGKVTSQEAMAFQDGTSSTTNSTASSSSSDNSGNSSSTDQQSLATLMKIAQLIQAYGFDSGNSSTSAISTTA